MANGNILALWNRLAGRQQTAEIDATTNGLIVRAFQSFIATATSARTANYTVGSFATDVIGTDRKSVV